MTLKQHWQKTVRLNTELINAALAYGRYHNKDNYGTPSQMDRSMKKLLKAMEAMTEHLTGEGIKKLKPTGPVTVYSKGNEVIYLINKP